EHRRAVELGVPADEVVLPRTEAALAAGPGLGAAVAQVDEHRFGVPVLRLARQHGPAFEDQHARTGAGELQRHRASTDAGADDHDVLPHAAQAIRFSVFTSKQTSL